MTTTTEFQKVHLDEQMVREFIAAEIEAEGANHVYERVNPDKPAWPGLVCQYVNNGVASCLIGRILFRAGVPLDVLSAYEGNAARKVASALTDADADLTRKLDNLQGAQDCGTTWGQAAIDSKLR
jgi:hypothetical protein